MSGTINYLNDGTKIKPTGRVDTTSYSITLVEFEILEGKCKGELIWRI